VLYNNFFSEIASQVYIKCLTVLLKYFTIFFSRKCFRSFNKCFTTFFVKNILQYYNHKNQKVI